MLQLISFFVNILKIISGWIIFIKLATDPHGHTQTIMQFIYLNILKICVICLSERSVDPAVRGPVKSF